MHIVLGGLIYGYEYGAMNRLSRSWNDKGQEAFYLYNGLGQRTGESVNGDEEDYLLDLTKGYHNLLGIQKEESGRFTAEDVIKGNNVIPSTLNNYNYCWNNPAIFADHDGRYPIYTIIGEHDYKFRRSGRKCC